MQKSISRPKSSISGRPTFPKKSRLTKANKTTSLTGTSFEAERMEGPVCKDVASCGAIGVFREASPETSTNAGDGLGVYLRQIGVFQRLSRVEEVQLGMVVRSGFDAFASHMLAAGLLQASLLESAGVLISAAPGEGNCLRSVADLAAKIYAECGSLFVLNGGLPQSNAVRARQAFLELFKALELHPSQCFERLREMCTTWSALRRRQKPECAASQDAIRAYAAKNLMSVYEFELFLARARALEAAVLAARNRMVDANLRLVVKQAQALAHGPLPVMDLIQEGNIGLVLAAERFDERLGWRFSTFATTLIKNTMLRAIDNLARTVRLPVHQCEQLRKLDRVLWRLESQMSRTPLTAELAAASGFSEEKVRVLLAMRQGTVSLEEPSAPGSDLSVGERLGDYSALTVFYGTPHGMAWVEDHLENIGESERDAVVLRFGLRGHEPRNVEEVARMLGLTRQRVTRLVQDGLNRLRCSILGLESSRNAAA